MTLPASEADSIGSGQDPSAREGRPPAGVTIGRGPGVIPPFAAPPREGVKRRRWIGVGIGTAIAVLCCGGGGAGLFGLVVAIGNERVSDARTVVSKYLDDKKDGHFPSAYQLLCEDLKDHYTLTEFTAEVDGDPILDFTVDQPSGSGSDLYVPVTVDYLSGNRQDVEYAVTVDADGSSRVCGPTGF